MGKLYLFLLVIYLLRMDPSCHAQTIVKVSDPRVEIKDNTLYISYDILNSGPEDTFNVSIEINDSEGNKIDAKAFDGDIGEGVTGGSNKHITWNLEADRIFLDTRIFITVYAELIPPPEPEIAANEDQSMKERPPAEISNSYNRTGIILQSLAFPGLGLSRMTGNPHWLRGVAGYGCLAGSIILNRMAISTYEDYKYTVPGTEKENFLTKSVNQDNISEILAYTAIGIWITDFVWTLIGSSDLKKPSLYSDKRGLSLTTALDRQHQIPLLGIRYCF